MVNSIKKYTISLIYSPFTDKHLNEVFAISKAIESFGNKVLIFKANRDIISELKKESIDLAFNLARKSEIEGYNTSIPAICELLDIFVIGPNVFSASVYNSEDIFLQILKYDEIPFITNLSLQDTPNLIQIFLLGTINPWYFLKTPSYISIDSTLEPKIIEISKRAFSSIHGSDYCKFTFFLENENSFLIEINQMPLLGSDSDFAKLAKLKGINYINFINIIVYNALKRYNLQIPEEYEPLIDLIEKNLYSPKV